MIYLMSEKYSGFDIMIAIIMDIMPRLAGLDIKNIIMMKLSNII